MPAPFMGFLKSLAKDAIDCGEHAQCSQRATGAESASGWHSRTGRGCRAPLRTAQGANQCLPHTPLNQSHDLRLAPPQSNHMDEGAHDGPRPAPSMCQATLCRPGLRCRAASPNGAPKGGYPGHRHLPNMGPSTALFTSSCPRLSYFRLCLTWPFEMR